MIRQPPIPTLFPYPTLPRSRPKAPDRLLNRRNRSRDVADREVARFVLHNLGKVHVPNVVENGILESREREAAAVMLRQPLRSEEHTSELQSRQYLVCRLLLE